MRNRAKLESAEYKKLAAECNMVRDVLEKFIADVKEVLTAVENDRLLDRFLKIDMLRFTIEQNMAMNHPLEYHRCCDWFDYRSCDYDSYNEYLNKSIKRLEDKSR